MSTLAGNKISATYPLLLKIISGGIDGTLRKVEDGDGTDSTLKIASDSIAIDAGDELFLDGGYDTKIRESSADIMDFYVGGVHMLSLDETNDEVVINEGNGDINFRVESDDNGNMLFVDAGNNRVGIGVDDPDGLLEIAESSDSENSQLHIKNINTGSSAGCGVRLDADGNFLKMISYGDNHASNSDLNRIYTSASNTDISIDLGTLGEGIYIESGGNVGIGTTNPDTTLHIEREGGTFARFENTDSNSWMEFNINDDGAGGNNGLYITFYRDGDRDAWMGPGSGDSRNLYFANEAAGKSIYLSTTKDGEDNELIRMTVDDEGNVGIGDTTPSQKLDVNGNVRADDYIEYTEDFTGDAISILKDVSVRDGEGEWKPVDHSSWPSEVIYEDVKQGTCEEADLPEHAECSDQGDGTYIVYTRSLSGVSAINTRAIQQLNARVEALENNQQEDA